EINQVEGIAIYSIDNSMLDSWNSPDSPENIFDQLSIHYLQFYSMLENGLSNFKEIVISHEQGYIYVRALPDLLIMAITRRPTEITLIRLIINVQISSLLNSKQLQKTIKKMSMESQNFLEKKFLDDTERELLKKLTK
ncbi:MAG: hypothetical protein JXL67_11290, partial [Calditrichaeota bacterium]|nr:hypothetical protein [Calditrichota bacterium]